MPFSFFFGLCGWRTDPCRYTFQGPPFHVSSPPMCVRDLIALGPRTLSTRPVCHISAKDEKEFPFPCTQCTTLTVFLPLATCKIPVSPVLRRKLFSYDLSLATPSSPPWVFSSRSAEVTTVSALVVRPLCLRKQSFFGCTSY